jgi:two-component sensor histidine kinase
MVLGQPRPMARERGGQKDAAVAPPRPSAGAGPAGDRDVLVRELFHRTRNTLQLVAALAHLRAQEPAAQALALEVERRVETIMLVQDGLYEASDLNKVDLCLIASRIASYIAERFSVDGGRIELALPAGSEPVAIDAAMPCALALYEILSNCFLHAFPGSRLGRVEVGLGRLPGGSLFLSVADDGVGLPEAFDKRRPCNAGLSILLCLAEQLRARLSFERLEPGLAVRLEFDDGRFEPRLP